jgi:hypothetical protein
MIILIANDETQVILSDSAAECSAYIKDAFWGDAFYYSLDRTLNVPFATGEQLQLLKQVLEAKVADDAPFIPIKGTVQIGGLLVDAPPFVDLYWSGTRTCNTMQYLNEHQIVELLLVADSMCISDLRAGIIHLMLHKIVTNQMKFTDFFRYRVRASLMLLIQEIYEKGLRP